MRFNYLTLYNINNYMEILDCTIRDGGYINNWRFDTQLVKKYIETCLKSNIISYIELGFLNKEEKYADKYNGIWRSLTHNIIDSYKSNLKLAVMIDFTSFDESKLLPQNETSIDLIRVAFHKKDMHEAIAFCGRLKKLGYSVSANAMATINYHEDDLNELINLSNYHKLDYLYIADSYGNCFPNDISRMIKFMRERTKIKIGVHLHNNFQNGFANFLESINCQADIVDSTMYGMGRGVGNLTTESVCCLLNKKLNYKYNLIDLFYFIDNFIVKNFFGQVGNWGYNLPYLISGYFDCHPNYIAKLYTSFNHSTLSIENIYSYCQDIKNNGENKYFSIDTMNKYTQLNKIFEK